MHVALNVCCFNHITFTFYLSILYKLHCPALTLANVLNQYLCLSRECEYWSDNCTVRPHRAASRILSLCHMRQGHETCPAKIKLELLMQRQTWGPRWGPFGVEARGSSTSLSASLTSALRLANDTILTPSAYICKHYDAHIWRGRSKDSFEQLGTLHTRVLRATFAQWCL